MPTSEIFSGALTVGALHGDPAGQAVPNVSGGGLPGNPGGVDTAGIEPSVLSKWTPARLPALEILTSAAITLFFLPSRLGDSVLLFPLNTAFWSLMFELVVNCTIFVYDEKFQPGVCSAS